jgi:hypothetical protein
VKLPGTFGAVRKSGGPSAKAIGRALAGAGLDWHDVAATLADGLPACRTPDPPPRQSDPIPPLWSELEPCDREIWLETLACQGWLGGWDKDFVDTISEQLSRNPSRTFSTKQQLILNRLIGRAVRCGVRP